MTQHGGHLDQIKEEITMEKKRATDEQIVRALCQAEGEEKIGKIGR